MQNVPNCDEAGLENTLNTNGIDTKHFHTLLSPDQKNNTESSFEKAIRKQQQLFTICNTLERQNTLLQELENLLNSKNGVIWLDTQIQQFKAFCPPKILLQLSKPSRTSTNNKIEYSEIIHLNFLSLINEIFYIPLNALTKIKTGSMSDHERKEWYEWCLKVDQQLVMFNVQIISAQSFFNVKSFDKICNLAKDDTIRQQLGNIEYLFRQKTSSAEDVECSD